MSDVKTARSYRGALVDDNMVVSLNIKWMVQLCVLVGAIVYGYYRIESRLGKLESDLVEADSTIRSLLNKHSVEEERKRAELESKLSFYEKELKLNLNPMSWGKKKRK
jgi:hypothetical protein|tara:strand:+ start:59 stop:382 length:324 start_codon:yes stop_codon:yes gene_type:complete